MFVNIHKTNVDPESREPFGTLRDANPIYIFLMRHRISLNDDHIHNYELTSSTTAWETLSTVLSEKKQYGRLLYGVSFQAMNLPANIPTFCINYCLKYLLTLAYLIITCSYIFFLNTIRSSRFSSALIFPLFNCSFDKIVSNFFLISYL